jgi:hypothetical protein
MQPETNVDKYRLAAGRAHPDAFSFVTTGDLLRLALAVNDLREMRV